MLSGYLGVPVGIFAMGATGRDRIKRQSPMRRRSKHLVDNDSAALTWRIAAVTDLHWSDTGPKTLRLIPPLACRLHRVDVEIQHMLENAHFLAKAA